MKSQNDPAAGELARPDLYEANVGGGEQMAVSGGWGTSVIDRAWKDLERYLTTQQYLAEAIARL